jgi:CDK-activating kinase assembly factor MAT1
LQIETVVFNLVNNIDIVETNRTIEQYKKDNKEQIGKSRSRLNDELLELDTILENEKMRAEMLRLESLTLEKQEKLRKLKNHEALIDDLMFSETDAKSIMASHKNSKANIDYDIDPIQTAPSVPAPVAFTSGIGFGSGRTSFLPVPKAEEVPLFVYEELNLDFGGLNPPSIEELKSSQSAYLNHVKAATPAELAGGFHSSIACRRAIQDAFSDITLQPKLIKKCEAMDVS